VNVGEDRDPHRRPTLPQGVAALALGAAGLVAGALLWRTKVPELDLPDLAPDAYFGAEELARIERFRRVSRLFLLGSLALELGALALVVWKGRPLAGLLSDLVGGRVRAGVAVALVAALAVSLATLPVAAASHWWRRRYGLSEQGYPAWLWDQALGFAVTAVAVAIAVAVAMLLAARLGEAWWLPGAAVFAALGAAFALAQPVVIQPLFNRFEPLPDRRLAVEVKRLGDRMGVHVETVQVADASRRTTTANAYVAGIGPTRRVVFDDTILDGRFTPAELVSVAAHELGHVSRRHVWKGVAWFALLTVPGLFLAARAAEWRGGLTDPAAVPIALFAALAFFLATLPLQTAVSRRYEAEADWLALEATRDPRSAIGLERRFVTTSLGDPDPPAWVKLWFATHPTPMERIAMAEVFRGS
jgi:Zn-dependent protease with chaperone function